MKGSGFLLIAALIGGAYFLSKKSGSSIADDLSGLFGGGGGGGGDGGGNTNPIGSGVNDIINTLFGGSAAGIGDTNSVMPALSTVSLPTGLNPEITYENSTAQQIALGNAPATDPELAIGGSSIINNSSLIQGADQPRLASGQYVQAISPSATPAQVNQLLSMGYIVQQGNTLITNPLVTVQGSGAQILNEYSTVKAF